MSSKNPDFKRMTDLELLAYKGNNPLKHAEVDRRKKLLKLSKLSVIKTES